MKDIFMESLGCYGNVDRAPGARVISQAYFALIRREEKAVHNLPTYQASWFDLHSIPKLMLDHNQMVKDALEKLRRKTRYRPIGFELLPEKFTIPQLRHLYESIHSQPLDRRNFRKKILSLNILEKLEEKDKSNSKKGAFLYQFKKEQYLEMVESGIEGIFKL